MNSCKNIVLYNIKDNQLGRLKDFLKVLEIENTEHSISRWSDYRIMDTDIWCKMHNLEMNGNFKLMN